MADVKYVSATRVYAKDAPPAVDAPRPGHQGRRVHGPGRPVRIGQVHRAAHAGRAGAAATAGASRSATRTSPSSRPRTATSRWCSRTTPCTRSMTVAENMGFALKMQGVPKDERARRVREAARLLDLDDSCSTASPRRCPAGSGSGWPWAAPSSASPQVFLMDEPLSNLDAKLRVQTRSQIAELQRRLGITTVYVTHDQVEAMTMGHRVAVLADGHAAAVRHAAPAVRQPGQPVRRRVHRLPGDEPADGAAHRGRRPAGRDGYPAAAPRCARRPARRPARDRPRHPARTPAPGERFRAGGRRGDAGGRSSAPTPCCMCGWPRTTTWWCARTEGRKPPARDNRSPSASSRMTCSPSTPRRALALPAKPQPLNARTLKYWSDRVGGCRPTIAAWSRRASCTSASAASTAPTRRCTSTA